MGRNGTWLRRRRQTNLSRAFATPELLPRLGILAILLSLVLPLLNRIRDGKPISIFAIALPAILVVIVAYFWIRGLASDRRWRRDRDRE